MMLKLSGLGKRYGDRWAVRDVDLELSDGVVGLVGPNGAGKTTIMRMLATLTRRTSGNIVWDGADIDSNPARLRAQLGYLPQDFGVYGELTARDFLRFIAEMKHIDSAQARRRVDEMLELVNLTADANRRLRTYSGGMRQRIGIAQALLNDPRLLIVDEPTAGLDPLERVRFRTLLAGLTDGRLIILSTHIVGDVEAVASRLILLHRGSVLEDTTPERLVETAGGGVWSVTTTAQAAADLQRRFPVSGLVSHGTQVVVRIVAPNQPLPGAAPVAPSLEDAYLARMRAAG